MLFDHLLLLALVAAAGVGIALWLLFLRYPKFGYICLFLSIVAGQLARISLGTDERGGAAIIVTDIVVLFIGSAWIMHKLIYERQLTKTPFSMPILVFCVVALLSYLVGLVNLLNIDSLNLKSAIVSFSYWFRFAAYALLYFITAEFVQKSKSRLNFLLKLILWTSILVSIGGFIQLVIMPDFTAYAIQYGWDPHQDRLLGTFFDPNFIGTYFAMIMALAISIYPTSSKHIKALIVFSVLFCSVALLLTFSRTGYIAFIAAFLLIGILRSPKMLLIGAICITLGVVASPRAVQRITDGLSVDETGLKRVYSWDKGTRILNNFPILGVGYNNLATVQDFYALVDEFDVNNRGGLENTLLTIFVTTGITGGLAYIWLWWVFLSASFKAWYRKKLFNSADRDLGLGIASAFIALLVSSMFMNSLLYPFLLVHIWILAALIPSYDRALTY
ncbi:MAG: O-antigen ligase family protein [Candidatus Abawacabacteria bacterium]|nr:O-antigen ligase family protein [Candidatus Abawacabacteria bacterium]